jgi:hypothetical protein
MHANVINATRSKARFLIKFSDSLDSKSVRSVRLFPARAVRSSGFGVLNSVFGFLSDAKNSKRSCGRIGSEGQGYLSDGAHFA